MMKVVVAGGTGFLGEPLVRSLVARGDDVVVLSRNPARVGIGRGVAWDGQTQGAWSEELSTAGAVVNLAGENIGDRRWTAERKRKLINSRLQATAALVEALRKAGGEKTLISASAVGYYGDRGGEVLDETAARGSGFLADLVSEWEGAARGAEDIARVVLLRFGVILAPEGGALRKMLLPFRFGVGGPIGSGAQWMSWVHRDDAVSLIIWALDRPEIRGVYNASAPEPVTNREFTRELGRALRRAAFLPIPPFVLRAVFGEMAKETLLGGQRVQPARATREGFAFRYGNLAHALMSLL